MPFGEGRTTGDIMKTFSWKQFVLRAGFALALLALLFAITDFEELVRLFREADLWPLVLAVLAVCASTLICALRWWAVGHAIGLRLPYKEAAADYFGCTLFNHVLPGGVLGDVARAWRHRHQGGAALAAHSVIAERVMGQTMFVLFILAGLVLSLLDPQLRKSALLSVYGLVVGVYVTIALCAIFGKHLSGRLGLMVRDFHTAMETLGRWGAVKMIALSFFMVAAFILAFHLCAVSLGLSVPLALLIGAVPLIKATMMLPLSVGGWGIRESAAGGIWAIVGMSSTHGIALSVAYGLVFLLASLPGLLFWSDPGKILSGLPQQDQETA